MPRPRAPVGREAWRRSLACEDPAWSAVVSDCASDDRQRFQSARPATARRTAAKRVTVMPLTDTAIRNARPGGKPVKLFDEGGLYLILTPAVARWWRLDYRYGGKRRTLSMGVYPHVSLKDGHVWSPELRLTDYGPLPHPTQLCGSICAVPRHMATIRVPLSAFGAKQCHQRASGLSWRFVPRHLHCRRSRVLGVDPQALTVGVAPF